MQLGELPYLLLSQIGVAAATLCCRAAALV